jgi:hypothetical protein
LEINELFLKSPATALWSQVTRTPGANPDYQAKVKKMDEMNSKIFEVYLKRKRKEFLFNNHCFIC